MSKLRKIMVMALSGVMMFSQVAFAENAKTTDKINDDVLSKSKLFEVVDGYVREVNYERRI